MVLPLSETEAEKATFYINKLYPSSGTKGGLMFKGVNLFNKNTFIYSLQRYETPAPLYAPLLPVEQQSRGAPRL